jgi:hypothetical protein
VTSTDIEREETFLQLMNDEVAKAVQCMNARGCRELAKLLRMKTTPWALPEFTTVAVNIIEAAEAAAEDIEGARSWIRGSLEASRVARKIERVASTWTRRRKARRRMLAIARDLRRSWFAASQEPGIMDALAVGYPGLIMEDL